MAQLISTFQSFAVIITLILSIDSARACGIWGQLFCDYCWDGQYTQGIDTFVANAQVAANCTVTTSGGKTVYYWGTDITDNNGNFQAGITGTSDLLGTASAEASFLKGLFRGQSFLLGQLSGTAVVGCKISVSSTGKCSILSYNDGSFLTNGENGNGWSSSKVSLHQYLSTGLADIYVGPSDSATTSVSVTPPVRGQGTSKMCPASPPPPPGSKGDPHFTGADSSHFDFSGKPGNNYCLVSDRHLHINAFYGGRFDRWGDNPHKSLTWMRNVAILWGDHVVTLNAREGARWQYDKGYLASIEVDGQSITLPEVDSSLSLLNGDLEITWLAAKMPSGMDYVDVYMLKITDVLLMRLTLRPEVEILRTSTDGLVHFDIEIPKADLSDSVHGILGQTFRSDHRYRLSKQRLFHSSLLDAEVVPGDNAEGFLDGDVDYYRSSNLKAADCKVSRFVGHKARIHDSQPAIQLTSSSARSILSKGINRKFMS